MERSRLPKQFPLFRSEAQARVLAAIFLHGPIYLTAIAEQARLPTSTVHREVDRLERSGLLTTQRVGRHRVAAPNPESPYVEDVRSIVLKTYGPPAVVAEELERVNGIDEAYVFGSWALRADDIAGPSAADIDVVVVGGAVVGDVYDAAERAEAQLGLEVNPVIVSSEEWQQPREGFLARVKSGALVRVK